MIYQNAYVFTKNGRFEYGSFSVREGRFAPAEEAAGEERIDLQGSFVIPGLIDIHTHGCAGAEKELGSIEAGKRADFVICDASLRRKEVYINGIRV